MSTDSTALWTPTAPPDAAALEAALAGLLAAAPAEAAPAQSGFPRISIITPSFNQARYLERTIRSVLNQGYPNLEYIVIDGGSSDGSVDIIKRYAPRLAHWVSEPDRGQAHALNKGLALATGEWIAFQNSDDLYLPGALHAVARAARERPESNLVIGHILHVDADDRLLDTQLVVPPKRWRQVFQGIQFHNQASFWRRDFGRRIGAFAEQYRFCFDYEYFIRMVFSSELKPALVDRYLGAFRWHGEAKSSTILDVAKREHDEIVGAHRKGLWRLPLSPLMLVAARATKALHLTAHGHAWYLFRH